jgi:hypothetical protein
MRELARVGDPRCGEGAEDQSEGGEGGRDRREGRSGGLVGEGEGAQGAEVGVEDDRAASGA